MNFELLEADAVNVAIGQLVCKLLYCPYQLSLSRASWMAFLAFSTLA